MGNFHTQSEEYREYARLATSAEQSVYSNPRASLALFGAFAEQLTKLICKLDGLYDNNFSQKQRIERMQFPRYDYPASFLKALDDIRRLRNPANHDNEFKPTIKMALLADKKAYLVWSWFLEVFSQDEVEAYKEPVERKNSDEIVEKQAKKIEKLEAEIEQFKNNVQAISLDEEAKQKRHLVNADFAKRHPMNEAETRELIDQQLRDAHWIADTVKYNNWTHQTQPEKGKNMAIAEWVLPTGDRADYALFIGKKLVGVVETKRWNEDISGQFAQPKDYSSAFPKSDSYELLDCEMGKYKVPFIYTTNGRPYFKQYDQKSGVWFWDARNPKESSYGLEAFHTPDDLKLKLSAVSQKEANTGLVNDADYPAFARRPYQMEAVRKVEEAIESGQRKILLAMATGTGKTRTALSLMYRLLKHRRARRILYLVDRKSLGEQTANAIKDNKINNVALSDIYNLMGLDGKVPDPSTKIHIATVQGMIKRLFGDDDTGKLSVGSYDCIIVDEAHRGYAEDRETSDEEYQFYSQEDYQSQYTRVVNYFDAVAIAMTATPALQTVDIFGQPVFSYSYQEAVLDNFLVDHNAPKIIETKLSQEGIHFKKNSEIDLFDQETESVQTETLPDDMDFDLGDFNKQVVTENFNRVVCEYLAQNLDPNDSSLGKTLIFAANDAHADMVVKLLKKAFADAGNPVDDDSIEKITGYLRNPDREIRRFKNEEYPNIAVTVDLLSTGVDVPAITNVVFLRRVQSRILYEQMLGRATRLCPEINKDHFEIYDAVGIYDAMNKVTNMKPVVKDPHHNVNYFINHKEEFAVAEKSSYYQVEMTGAIERKIKRLSDNKKKEFERLAEVSSTDEWASSLANMSNKDFMSEWNRFELLNEMKTVSPKQYISNAEDKLQNVRVGYGKNNEKPEDYLESFNHFVKDNINEISALEIIAKRPKELTLNDLKEIRLILEQNGFKENDLQSAWKTVNHVQTTADIISFIRQASLGAPLKDHETRIHEAMQKVYGMADWNLNQERWLKRIEKQLVQSTVLGPTAQRAFDDNSIFRSQAGGYKQMKKIFNGQTDEIIKILNDNLYA